MTRVSLKNIVRNNRLRKQPREENVKTRTTKLKWRWAGHLQTFKDE